MDATTSSLIIGIASSLVATLLFIGGSLFLRKGFLPWYADKVYRGVRIDGTWAMEAFGDHDGVAVTLALKQSGENVSGNVYVNVDDSRMTFEFAGRVQNMYLSGICHPQSKRHIDPMTFLLHIDFYGGNLKMQGGMCLVKQAAEVSANSNVCFNLQDS